jgi:hypothetical protein
VDGEGAFLTAPVIVDDTLVAAHRGGRVVYGVTADGRALPDAEISGATTAFEGEVVEFDASRSTSAAGTIEAYEWTVIPPRQSQAAVAEGTSREFEFTAEVGGEYRINLQVTDDIGLTGLASTMVTAERLLFTFDRGTYVPKDGLRRTMETPFVACFGVGNRNDEPFDTTLSLSLPEGATVESHEDAGGEWTGSG